MTGLKLGNLFSRKYVAVVNASDNTLGRAPSYMPGASFIAALKVVPSSDMAPVLAKDTSFSVLKASFYDHAPTNLEPRSLHNMDGVLTSFMLDLFDTLQKS